MPLTAKSVRLPPVCLGASWQKSKTNKRVKQADGDWTGYGHPRLRTLMKLNAELQRAGHGWRAPRIRAWNGKTDRWVNQRVREGVSVTAKDGTVVVRSDGEKVTCR